jgi:HAD superfamily hydrolase (TIGR01459 family)
MSPSLPPFTDHFRTLASAYEVLLCDVWGVVHNGVVASHDACDALMQFRRQGGTVILITNAPRPGEAVVPLLDRLKVPREAYDGIVSSGGVTRSLVLERKDQSIFHIGPERDLPIFQGLGLRIAPMESADYVVCSGLFDDTTETPQNYQDLLGKMRARNLLMICANPDVVVERGHELVYCAGAIADLYAAAGGEVVYAGKPYRPIYQQALEAAQSARGRAVDRQRVLAIGDSVRTDLKGAADFGIDCLFVTAGIHAEEIGGRDDPDPAALSDIFAEAGVFPKAVTRGLAW